jgi:DNA mismatch repair protein MutL
LASIAAIAHVELKTKQEQEELGTHLIIEGSKFITQEPAVLPKGTSFLVKNLFFNIPARRNFLKSDQVEFKHIVDEFQRIVLAHPNISFSLYHNGLEVYNLPQSNLRQRIVNVFLGKTNEKLVPIQEQTELVTIQGFIGKPEFAKKNKSEQFFFVNNRFIKSAYLNHAVNAAYEGLLKDSSQPSYFLYLEVPPHTIDINIHPTKTEIKFDNEQALYAILRASVKHSLGQFNVAPVLDFERDPNLDTPYQYQNKEASIPKIQVDSNFNPFAEETNTKPKATPTFSNYKKESAGSWESLYVGLKNDVLEVEPHFESEEVTASLFDDKETENEASKTAYQIQRKYIVSPIKSGLVIIDQNRAHQRILYEQILTNITVNQAGSQQLLFPLELHFTKNELTLLHDIQDTLSQTGFVFEKFTKESVIISGIPSNFKETEAFKALEQVISDLQEEIPDSSFSQTDAIAKSMAQSLAVKNGVSLSETACENLVNNLFACREPDVSPFNKQTFITISCDELDKKFNS